MLGGELAETADVQENPASHHGEAISAHRVGLEDGLGDEI